LRIADQGWLEIFFKIADWHEENNSDVTCT